LSNIKRLVNGRGAARNVMAGEKGLGRKKSHVATDTDGRLPIILTTTDVSDLTAPR